jgi:hypothetical protein
MCSEDRFKGGITREPTLEKYLAHVGRMENHFKDFTIEHIDKNKNDEANKLAKAATQKHRDKKVKQRTFCMGDLVLLRSPCTESSGKLESKWDGSYAVTEKSRPRSYRLSDS